MDGFHSPEVQVIFMYFRGPTLKFRNSWINMDQGIEWESKIAYMQDVCSHVAFRLRIAGGHR